MLFLMNDTVLDVDLKALTPPTEAARFASLPLKAVVDLGAEMFAQAPLLHRTQPERAKRLAALIFVRSGQVNAALFEAPSAGCKPAMVYSRLADVSMEVMAELYAEQLRENLTPVLTDRRVWRRMAA